MKSLFINILKTVLFFGFFIIVIILKKLLSELIQN